MLNIQMDGLIAAVEQRPAALSATDASAGNSSIREEGRGFSIAMVGDSTMRVRERNSQEKGREAGQNRKTKGEQHPFVAFGNASLAVSLGSALHVRLIGATDDTQAAAAVAAKRHREHRGSLPSAAYVPLWRR